MNSSLLRRAVTAAIALVAITTLGACAAGGTVTSSVRVGWSGEIPSLDPAASSSFASFVFLTQLYPSLLVVDPERPDPALEIAESAEWTAPGVYTVVLKPRLEFANGDDLTASDVKFSLERQLALQPADGAWRGLSNLESIEIIDDTTIQFHLGSEIDTGFPFVLAGPAGLVLDEESFFADELTPDDDILDAQPFGGPYALESSGSGELTLTPYGGFGGATLAASTIELH
ncbi:MAG TPA: ABC transporter substrate-binding protein, partial [Pseudolysinimonas sp.]|nr:ABC transporter substrate-binding protein [Pseudolysinimonas sp.]